MSDLSFRGVRGIGSLFTRLRCSLMTIATRGDVRAGGLEKQTILIVDDTPQNLTILGELLQPSYRVRAANSGERALRAAGLQPRPDLILLDVMMPEMDGYTAMREIRNRPEWRRLPIIALTAKAMKDDQEKCLAAGANDYIAKPLDVEKLLSLVRVWMPK